MKTKKSVSKNKNHKSSKTINKSKSLVKFLPDRLKYDVYKPKHLPKSVGRGVLDEEIQRFLNPPRGEGDPPKLGQDDLSSANILYARKEHDKLLPGAFYDFKGTTGAILVPTKINNQPGFVTVRTFKPKGHTSKDGALLYMHGGGYTVGYLDQFEDTARIMSEFSGLMVFLIEYKLAPEYKFPHQLQEYAAVLNYVIDNHSSLKINPKKVVIAGDSAGGNMTCVMSQTYPDKICFGVPFYPEARLPFDTPAAIENRYGLYLETAGILTFAYNYLTEHDDYNLPRITPMNGDLSVTAPNVIITNGYDPLRDVGFEYAEKLDKHNNLIELIHFPSFPHGWIQMTHISDQALVSLKQVSKRIGELANKMCK